MVRLVFNDELKTMITMLEESFTSYDYKQIGDMRSPYTIRMFELLKQYARIKKRRIPLETLRAQLGVENKYPRYGNFKARVINQAKKELDEKQGLTFSFDEIKEGRRVTELIFYIDVKDHKLLELPRKPIKDYSFIKQAQELLRKYNIEIDDDRVNNWQEYGIGILTNVIKEIHNNKMKHPAAYIEKVLKIKYDEVNERKKNIKAESEIASTLIINFIDNHKTREVTPDWFSQNKFFEHMSEHYTEESISNLWNDNKEYIMNSIQL